MPVYEYECDNCSLRFEKVQRFSDDPVRVCPNCGESVHRVIQPVGIIFKGSGFYVTDNRGKSSTTPPTRRDGESKGDGEAKSEPKSEPKSEAKGEAKSGETAAQSKSAESAPSS